jgi:ech hydrogenase subunit D
MKPVIEFISIVPMELLDRVSDLKEQGCRLVQICCSKKGEAFELDYSFDRAYTLINVKISVKPKDEIDSISAVFPPAFLYENEIESLFGLKVKHKAVDFGGKLYQTAKPTPFADKDGE